MPTPVEAVKAKSNIVEIVGSYIKLEKAGINYRARCPFHHERTPSFFVSPTRQSFHCFGCNKGGDVFTFVQEIEGLDFIGSLKVLAERTGVTLERSVVTGADVNRQRLFEILSAAKNFYASELSRQSAVRKYLHDRGLTDETIGNWGIGFAPAGWRSLYDFLKQKGYLPSDLEAAGLILRSNKPTASDRYFDRFRERIMFPLNDPSGRTVGFSGRVFGSDRPNEGKYVNSPQTTLFDKSKVLYGFDRAKLPIRQADEAILVEGQMDLLMSHQMGVTNVVAVSGTALTVDHLGLLRRLTEKVIMAFDADSAGFAAAKRGVELALSTGLEVRIAELPAGTDPAELIKGDPERWRQAVKLAKHVIDFILDTASRRGLEKRELAHLIRREAYPLIARLVYRVDQAHFVNKIAQMTNLPEEVVRADVAEIKVRSDPDAKVKPDEAVTRLTRIEQKLAGYYHWRSDLLDRKPENLWLERKAELVLEVEVINEGKTDQEIKHDISDLWRNWEQENKRMRLRELMNKLTEAERAQDVELVAKYLKECQDISRQLNEKS